jgi:hypothetical protein
MTGNNLSYIQNAWSADFLGVEALNRFSKNTGRFFLDRTLFNSMTIDNSLGDQTNSTNSTVNHCFFFDGVAMRFYTDDAGAFISF